MFGCYVLGSASSKYPSTLDENEYRALHQDEVVRSIENQYLAMKDRCRALGMIVPVPAADVLSGLFSEQEWARRFMIKTWELLENYSKERPLDRSDPNYPNRFFKEDGPIPITIASDMNLPFAATVARPRGRDHGPFRWSDIEYRYAILALRALGIPPQYHVDGNKKPEHARSTDGGEFKSCRKLLPFVFEVPNITGPRNPWDKDQAGCGGCDAHALVFSFIAVAQHVHYRMQGGLSTGTVRRRDIEREVRNLTNQEFSYENFWRLLARKQCQPSGGWDTANHWAMKKLGVYDELDQERRSHYNQDKLQKIKDDTASFHQQRNARLAEEKRDRARGVQAADNHQQDDIERKPKVEEKVKVEQDLYDSDVEVLPTPVLGKKSLAQGTKRVNAVASGSGFNGNAMRIKQEDGMIDEKPRIKRERLDLEVQVPKKKVKVEVE